MKICVIGYSGSGKSSFAGKLGKYYDITPTYIDKLHYQSNWIERDVNIRNQMLADIVENDAWVIDGNYSKVVPERFLKASKIFIFDFNRFKCIYGAMRRRIKFRHKARKSMTEGNRERLSFEFIKWILWDSRTKKRRQFYNHLKEQYPNKVVVFKKRSEVNRYLKTLQIFDFKAE